MAVYGRRGRATRSGRSSGAGVGDDVPRFGLLFREKADDLVVTARELAAHPALAGDAEFARRLGVLDAAAARPVTGSTFNRELIAAAHELAERGEDVLRVAW